MYNSNRKEYLSEKQSLRILGNQAKTVSKNFGTLSQKS